MSTNREITFSARDNGVENTIAKIKNSAKEMGRELVNEAVKNTETAKDAIKYYEEQVKLIEKRNRIEAKSAQITAESQRNRGIEAAGGDKSKVQEVQDQYTKSVREIQTGSKEDQIQIDLLRELVDAIKNTSRDEIRTENKTSGEERLHQSRLSNDEFNQLGDRLKDESQSNGSGEGIQGRGATGISSRTGAAAGGVSDALNSNTAMGTAGSMVGMLSGRAGVYGAAAYGGLKLGQSAALAGLDREKELRNLAGVSGISVDNLMTMGVGDSTTDYGPSDLNVSRAEFREVVAPGAARAYGSVRNLLGSRGKAMRGLEIEKGMGIDASLVNSLASATRTITGSGDAQDQANQLYRRMEVTGAFGKTGGDMSRMSDMMQSFVELQNTNLMRSGSMSRSGMTMDLMGRFESMGDIYKNDQYKTSTIQSLDSGLSQGGTSEANAIKMGILRKLNPEKGFFDLQIEMEKGINSKGYLQNVMKYVRNTGGDSNAQKILLDQLTGGQMRSADVSRMVDSNELDSAGLGNAFVAGGDKDFDFATRAIAASSGKETTRLVTEETVQDVKDTLTKSLDKGFRGVINKLDELMDVI